MLADEVLEHQRVYKAALHPVSDAMVRLNWEPSPRAAPEEVKPTAGLFERGNHAAAFCDENTKKQASPSPAMNAEVNQIRP